MLSRVANSLYWMSRNCERTEHNAHILGTQLIKTLEASKQEISAVHDWESLLDICASKKEFYSMSPELTLEKVVEYLTFSKQNINSMTNTVSFARENARITRDTIPNELWEVWNEFYLFGQEAQQETKCSLKDIHGFLNSIKKASFTASGIIDSAMARDLPYHFMKIGKWLERAEKTAIILTIFHERSKQTSEDDFIWRSALQFVNGTETYLKYYPPVVTKENVLKFLVSDPSFPRSIRYCMEHVWEAVKELERSKVSHYSWQMFALLDTMMTEFNENLNFHLTNEEMERFLHQSLERCVEFGKLFSNTYYLVEREHSI